VNLKTFGLAAFQWIILTIMLVGEVGLLTWVIPGQLIIWVGALIYWLVVGFNWINGGLFAVITILMIAGSLVDNVMMGASAKKTGASWFAVLASSLAGIIGSILWPPFGGLMAALVVIFVFELIRIRNPRQALKSMGGMMAGCGGSVIVRVLIGGLMIILWIVGAFLIKSG
jgi:uncharacterized protein